MRDPTLMIPALIALAAGTYAFRFAGIALRARLAVSPRALALLQTSSMILLGALAATQALAAGHHLAGAARPAGVLCGGLLAWRRAPIIAVVIAAAAVTGGLRAFGVD